MEQEEIDKQVADFKAMMAKEAPAPPPSPAAAEEIKAAAAETAPVKAGVLCLQPEMRDFIFDFLNQLPACEEFTT